MFILSNMKLYETNGPIRIPYPPQIRWSIVVMNQHTYLWMVHSVWDCLIFPGTFRSLQDNFDWRTAVPASSKWSDCMKHRKNKCMNPKLTWTSMAKKNTSPQAQKSATFPLFFQFLVGHVPNFWQLKPLVQLPHHPEGSSSAPTVRPKWNIKSWRLSWFWYDLEYISMGIPGS